METMWLGILIMLIWVSKVLGAAMVVRGDLSLSSLLGLKGINRLNSIWEWVNSNDRYQQLYKWIMNIQRK